MTEQRTLHIARTLVATLVIALGLNACGAGGGTPPGPGGMGQPPTAPTFVTASKQIFLDRILVSWQASPGASSYRVYFTISASVSEPCQNPTGDFLPLSGQISTTFYNHITAQPGVVYCYRVKAFNSAGESAFSSVDFGVMKGSPPSAPINVQASDGAFTDKIRISWASSSGANTYNVYRSTSSSAVPGLIASGIAETAYEDNTASAGQTYWYWISASNFYGEGPRGQPDSGFRDASPPAAPAAVSATQGDFGDRIVVSWSSSSKATTYSVFRAEGSPDGTYSKIATLTGSQTNPPPTSFNDDGTLATLPLPGVSYFYRIRAENPNGLSDLSSFAEGWRLPPAPVNVQASSNFTDHIHISWDPVNVPGYTVSYRILKSTTASGPLSLVTTTNATSYDDPAPAGVGYYYAIVTVVSDRQSFPSSPRALGSTNPLPPTPDPPTNLIASDGGSVDHIRLTWLAPFAGPAPTFYRIFRATGSAGPFSVLEDVPGSVTQYDDTSANPGPFYYYFVRSGTDVGLSLQPSNTDAGWRKPLAPTNLTASDGVSQTIVRLTWTGVPGFVKYRIYRSQNPPDPQAPCLTGFTEIATIEGTTYDDTPPLGALFYYCVRTLIGGNLSDPSNIDSGFSITQPQVPDIPTNVQATQNDTTRPGIVRVTWDASNGAQSYQVFRSSNPGGPYSPISPDTISVLYFDDDQNLTPDLIGLPFYYKVRAKNTNGYSDLSAEALGVAAGVKPNPPTGVKATDPFDTACYSPALPNKVIVCWLTVPGATKYNVYRSTSPTGPFVRIGQIPGPATQFEDNSVQPNVNYYYKVDAENGFGVSDPAPAGNGELGATSGNPLCKASSVDASDNLQVCDANGNPGGTFPCPFIQVRWPRTENTLTCGIPQFFRLYRSTTSTGPFYQVGTDIFPGSQACINPPPGDWVCYNDPTPPEGNVQPGRVYFYKVESLTPFQSSGLSVAQDQGSALKLVPPPAPPADFTIRTVPGTTIDATGNYRGNVILSWRANTEPDLDHYRVYKSLMPDVPITAANRIAIVPNTSTSYTDNAQCDQANPGSDTSNPAGTLNSVCYGTRYFYRVTAVSRNDSVVPTQYIEGAPSVELNIVPNPPNRLGWPIPLATWLKSNPLIAQADDAPDPETPELEIQAVNYNGQVYNFRLQGISGGNGTQYFRGATSTNPSPSRGFPGNMGVASFRSSPAVAQIFDLRCPEGPSPRNLPQDYLPYPPGLGDGTIDKYWWLGGDTLVRSGSQGGGDCREPVSRSFTDVSDAGRASSQALNYLTIKNSTYPSLYAGTPEYEIAVGGSGEVAIFRYEGDWNNPVYTQPAYPNQPVYPPPSNYAHSLWYTSLNFDGMGVVSGAPVLADTVTAGQLNSPTTFFSPPNVACPRGYGLSGSSPDGFPEVFAATEAGYIVGWQFCDETGPNYDEQQTPGAAGYLSIATNEPNIRDGVPDDPCEQDNLFVSLVPSPCRNDRSFTGYTVPMYIPPTVQGFPVRPNPLARYFATPVVVDFNGDGNKDILAAADDGCIYGYFANGRDFNGDGLADQIAGFPVCPGTSIRSSPAVADLDGDGFLELTVGTDNGFVVAINHDGSFLWQFDVGSTVESSPAIVDINQDGLPDVVVGADNRKVYAFRGTDGCLFTFDATLQRLGCPLFPTFGWPVTTGDVIRASPIVTDLNGDGDPDIVVGSFDGRLYGIYRDARMHPNNNNIHPLFNSCYPQATIPAEECAYVPGWPVNIGSNIAVAASVADADANGYLDIVFGSDNQNIYLLELRPILTPPSFFTTWWWSTFHADALRSGIYQGP
ncbi:MAG: FG-GAP-like repeat-containing protein [bacterium JZ-2024 1]